MCGIKRVLDAVDKYERVSIKIPKEQDWILKEDELTKKLFLEEIAAVYGCYNADFSVEYTGSLKTPINIVNLRFYDLRLLVGWIVKDKTSKQLQHALEALVAANPPAILLEKAASSYCISLSVPEETKWILEADYKLKMQFDVMLKREFKCQFVSLSNFSNTIKLEWE